MNKIDRSTPIDRKKEIATAFANWLNQFYVPVADYMWIARYGNSNIKLTAVQLYEEFLKKAWK